MNDYEAHLSSYDHSHKQRLKDMKAMVRDPASVARARKAEAKADGLISIKIPGQEAQQQQQQQGAIGGFKKGGFKKSGFKSAFAPVDGAAQPAATTAPTSKPSANEETFTKPALSKSLVPAESDTEDEGYEVYDPRYPTD